MRRLRRGRAGRACLGVLLGGTFVAGSGCVPWYPVSTVFSDQVKAAQPGGPSAGTVPWFCHSEGEGVDHIPENGHVHPAYEGLEKGDLAMEDCAQVAAFFDKAWASARRFPTRKDAIAAGGQQAVQFWEGVGTHDVIPGVTSYQFWEPDPERPFYLQYDGDGPDAKLAGMSWYVIRYAPGPPEGLAGKNDWWHSHTKLCYTSIGVVIGNEISDEECFMRGGLNKAYPYGWMLHAWIVPGYENRYDVFAGGFGCIRGTGPYAPPADPCHLVHGAHEHDHQAAALGAALDYLPPAPPAPGHSHGSVPGHRRPPT